MDAMTVDPRAHDERTAELYGKLNVAQGRLASVTAQIHRVAGDKLLERYTRREHWGMSFADALAIVQAKADAYPIDEAVWGGDHPVSVIQRHTTVAAEIVELAEAIELMNDIYHQHGWQRFFPCDNSNGHIHASLACHTLNKGQYRTQMSWRPDLSGHTVAEAIEKLGTWLCSVCFPDAPAEHCQTRSEATRAEREAKKAAAAEKAFDKKLRPETEQFRDGNVWGRRTQGDWVTTVHRALEVIRDEVEGRDQWGRGPASNHAELVRAAGMAKAVLLDRESRKPGTGATQEQIDKTIASKIKACRAEGARLDKEGNVTA